MALVHTKLCKLAPHADHDMSLFLGLHRYQFALNGSSTRAD